MSLAAKIINYLGGQKIYNREYVDDLLAEKENKLDFDVVATVKSNTVQVGENMYWPVAEDQERVVHSGQPFEFDVNGVHYSVNVPDETVTARVSQNVPPGFHAMDGTAELLASEYPKLAAFMPQNVTNEGKIWIPYVASHIIKITDEVE